MQDMQDMFQQKFNQMKEKNKSILQKAIKEKILEESIHESPEKECDVETASDQQMMSIFDEMHASLEQSKSPSFNPSMKEISPLRAKSPEVRKLLIDGYKTSTMMKLEEAADESNLQSVQLMVSVLDSPISNMGKKAGVFVADQ